MIDTVKHYRDYWKNESFVMPKTDGMIYNYEHSLGIEHEKRRMKFYFKYNKSPISEAEYENEFKKCFYFDKAIWEEGKNPDKVNISQFNGYHPEIIKSHSMYNARVIKD